MRTVAFVCEKGGCGKTTLAAEVFHHYRDAGVPTSLYSLDGQYSDPERGVKAEGAEVGVIDTPGVITDELREVIRVADAVVVPVRPTPNDVEPFERTMALVSELTDAPTIVVVNGWNRWRMSSAFDRWLESRGYDATVVRVPQSEAIVRAQALGRSVASVEPRGAAARAVGGLCRAVERTCGVEAGASSVSHGLGSLLRFLSDGERE